MLLLEHYKLCCYTTKSCYYTTIRDLLIQYPKSHYYAFKCYYYSHKLFQLYQQVLLIYELTRGTCSHLSETDGNLLLAAFFMTFSLQLTRRPMFSPMQSILSVFCQRRVLFVCAGDKWVRAVPALTGRPGLRYYLQLQQRIQLPEAAWPPGACSTQCTLQPGTHKHLFISTNRLTGDFTPVMSVLHKVHKRWAGGHTRRYVSPKCATGHMLCCETELREDLFPFTSSF